MTGNILVIGDVMIDEYIVGTVDRISPEAPVPVLTAESIHYGPGGAANTSLQVAALGIASRLVSAVGNHVINELILPASPCSLMPLLLAMSGIERKSRYMSAGQQLLRVDHPGKLGKFEALEVILEHVRHDGGGIQGILISDYGKGVIDSAVFDSLIRFALECGVPVILDSKQTGHDLGGVDVAVPNLKEAQAQTRLKDPERVAQELASRLRVGAIVTLGSEGAVVADGSTVLWVEAIPVRTVDAIGAGDAVAAAAAVSLSHGADVFEAARFAMEVAAQSTTYLGTCVPKTLC